MQAIRVEATCPEGDRPPIALRRAADAVAGAHGEAARGTERQGRAPRPDPGRRPPLGPDQRRLIHVRHRKREQRAGRAAGHRAEWGLLGGVRIRPIPGRRWEVG